MQFLNRCAGRVVGCVAVLSCLASLSGIHTRCSAQDGAGKPQNAPEATDAALEAQRRTQTMNNLKQIGLAMHIYHDANRSFPPRAKTDGNGKPLLSWRVSLLPYLDQEALAKEFRIDEPWDSEHNKKLIAKMPAVYRQPNSKVDDFKTCYLVPVAKGTMFETTKPTRVIDVTDGTSNTILAVEVNSENSVIWTKPDDVEVDLEMPFKRLLGLRPKGFYALIADGSVRFLSETLAPATLKSLFTRNGGEAIPR